MSLNVPTKIPHPIAVALMERYGEEFFLKAEELNDIVAAIRNLENGGKQKILPNGPYTLTADDHNCLLIADSTVITFDFENEVYPDGFSFEVIDTGNIGPISSTINTGNLDTTEGRWNFVSESGHTILLSRLPYSDVMSLGHGESVRFIRFGAHRLFHVSRSFYSSSFDREIFSNYTLLSFPKKQKIIVTGNENQEGPVIITVPKFFISNWSAEIINVIDGLVISNDVEVVFDLDRGEKLYSNTALEMNNPNSISIPYGGKLILEGIPTGIYADLNIQPQEIIQAPISWRLTVDYDQNLEQWVIYNPYAKEIYVSGLDYELLMEYSDGEMSNPTRLITLNSGNSRNHKTELPLLEEENMMLVGVKMLSGSQLLIDGVEYTTNQDVNAFISVEVIQSVPNSRTYSINFEITE